MTCYISTVPGTTLKIWGCSVTIFIILLNNFLIFNHLQLHLILMNIHIKNEESPKDKNNNNNKKNLLTVPKLQNYNWRMKNIFTPHFMF